MNKKESSSSDDSSSSSSSVKVEKPKEILISSEDDESRPNPIIEKSKREHKYRVEELLMKITKPSDK